MKETRDEFIARIQTIEPLSKLEPFYNELVVPCWCEREECSGWKLDGFRMLRLSEEGKLP